MTDPILNRPRVSDRGDRDLPFPAIISPTEAWIGPREKKENSIFSRRNDVHAYGEKGISDPVSKKERFDSHFNLQNSGPVQAAGFCRTAPRFRNRFLPGRGYGRNLIGYLFRPFRNHFFHAKQEGSLNRVQPWGGGDSSGESIVFGIGKDNEKQCPTLDYYHVQNQQGFLHSANNPQS